MPFKPPALDTIEEEKGFRPPPLDSEEGVQQPQVDLDSFLSAPRTPPRATFGPPAGPFGTSIVNEFPDASRVMAEQNPAGAMELGIPTFPTGPDESLGSALWNQSTEPFIPITKKQGTSTLGKIGAGLYNVGAGLVEGIESPLGVASLGLGIAPKFIQRLAALGFGVGATKAGAQSLGEASANTDWFNLLKYDPQLATEGFGMGAMGGLLARPTVRFGEQIGITPRDAQIVGARRMMDAIDASGKAPLPIPGLPGIRQLGVEAPPINPFFNPGVRDMASRALDEAQGKTVLVPGEQPAVEALRNEIQPSVIEPGAARQPMQRPGGGLAQGGKISFAAPAEAEAIPSARQSAINQAFGGAEQPPDVIARVRDLVGNKDRLTLENQLAELANAPAIGVSRSTSGDMLRLTRARLDEIKTGKLDPELSALRRTLYGEKLPALLKEPPIQAEITSEIVKPKGLLPEKGTSIEPEAPAPEVVPNAPPKPPAAPQAAKPPTLESIAETSPSDYFTLSQQWAAESMAGKEGAQSPQLRAEAAAKANPNPEAWQAAYDKAATEAAKIKSEVKANPESLIARQKELMGAAQRQQFFSEGLKIAKGAKPEAGGTPNPIVQEQQPAPVAGTVRFYQGSGGPEGAGQGGSFWTEKIDRARTYGPNIQFVDVPADVAAAARKAVEGKSGTPGDAILPEEFAKQGQPFKGEIPPEKVFDLEKTATEAAPDANTADRLIARLESLKVSNDAAGTGSLFTLNPRIFESYGKAFWNTGIDVAIVALKAGKSISEAVSAALVSLRSYAKERGMEIDETAIGQALAGILREESGAKVAAKPGVGKAGTGTGRNVSGSQGLVRVTQPAAAPKTLADVDRIFEPKKSQGPGLKEKAVHVIEAFRTGFSSRFRPLNKLAEDIAKAYGKTAKDVAGIFEQLKGSSGKAEADVYRFDREVSDLVKGQEKNFNRYVFLRRTLDRLRQDEADIRRAQAGEEVKTLNRRQVSDYTINDVERLLKEMETQVGSETMQRMDEAAGKYQTQLDAALKLQVDSGRMSPELYAAIKEGNQFYAPFKVMKYLEETMKPEGTGKRIDTAADYTKAMVGVEDPNFKLGDMLAAARQNIALSRILAEKNNAMRNISDLAAFDTEGRFIRKLKPGQDVPQGTDAVNVFEAGKRVRYAVNRDVAEAVQMHGAESGYLVARIASNLFRAGATTLNLPFQVSNILADAPRQALVSRYGLRQVQDFVRWPLELVHSLLASIQSDVIGSQNPALKTLTKIEPTGLAEKFRVENERLFKDFLDSGVAGTTIQEYLTPKALSRGEASLTLKGVGIAKTILNTIPHFAEAIEQTSKILGVKRAMRFEGVKSGKELASKIPEAITELRRFSGSPDFGRMGKWVDQYRLNMLYMFLNARIQGAVADLGRLGGRDGVGMAAKTWFKVGTAVGLPTAYLYLLNNSKEFKDDYAKRPEQEKRNYWLIPKSTFITTVDGEKVRDYWRVPKREISQWMANLVESGMDFAQERDPEAFWKWGIDTMENISPVNIQGKTAQERLESVGASLNPMIKAPLEVATGRDLYRHKAIVSDQIKKASPEQQYTDRTPEVFKALANKMPDVAPEVFRSPLILENMTKNLTAGLITQFLPRKPVEGRSGIEQNPLLQRFQGLPFTDSSEFDEKIAQFEREGVDEQLTRFRAADKILEANKGKPLPEIAQATLRDHGKDIPLLRRVIDMYVAKDRGITIQEKRILNLPVQQRAKYIEAELKGKTPEQKAALIRDWAIKRILTESVARELTQPIQ